MPSYDIHAAKLVDLPLIRRLAEKGTILDSELRCTREVDGPQSVLLARVCLSAVCIPWSGEPGVSELSDSFGCAAMIRSLKSSISRPNWMPSGAIQPGCI